MVEFDVRGCDAGGESPKPPGRAAFFFIRRSAYDDQGR
jgi:hypothetical protein